MQQNITFSPIASCIRTVSPDILPTTSPVFVSLSKKAMSCLNIVFKYILLIRDACLSPVTIQQVTSDKNQTQVFPVSHDALHKIHFNFKSEKKYLRKQAATPEPSAKYTNFRET